MDDVNNPYITFDSEGRCNYCTNYHAKADDIVTDDLHTLWNQINYDGMNERYDAVLGVSGGVDSSFVAYLAWKAGVRLLLTHFDNGFDTEEGKHNVKVIIENTGFDYVPNSCDLEEIHDLKRAYLKSGVLNFEVVCDMAFMAATYRVAQEYGVKCLLGGNNWATEGILPKAWGYRHTDAVNIRDIHDKHGSIPLKTYPIMSFTELVRLRRKIPKETPLNHIRYNRREAKQILREAWSWRDYGDKHCECICTRFYQKYIHPRRTGWDKRKPHYSSLICSGQMTREEALTKLSTPISFAQYYFQPYYPGQYLEDRDVFTEKLGITDDELQAYIDQPIVPNQAYKTNDRQYNTLRLGKRLILSPMRALRKAFA
jgi:hypothetical protein